MVRYMRAQPGKYLTSLATLVELNPFVILRILLDIDCPVSVAVVSSSTALTSGAAPEAPPGTASPLRLQLLSECGLRTDTDSRARRWQRL
jgi:hypothetical protein